jgi:hypothetical protein
VHYAGAQKNGMKSEDEQQEQLHSKYEKDMSGFMKLSLTAKVRAVKHDMSLL